MKIEFRSIGRIRTPYENTPPHQPDPEAGDGFYIDLDPEYASGLDKLEAFNYIHVLFHLDRQRGPVTMRAHPPMAKGMEVGLFASRSPRRPNSIGLSTVRLKRIEGARIHISGIDVLDDTPLLDIKPYIRRLDIKEDANDGWLDELGD